jgi:hypothetical protein
MPPADPPSVQLQFEPEFLPLLRAYGYLRLAGVAPRQAAAAVARLQAALAAQGGPDLRAWRRQILEDPAWRERRPTEVAPPPAPTGRHFAARAARPGAADPARG